DGEAVLALYEPGAAFVLPTGDVIEGVDNIAQALGGFFAMKPRIDLRTTRVLRSGDTAIVYSLDRHGHGPRRHGRGDVGNADRGPAPAARRNLAVPHRRPGLVRPDRRAVQVPGLIPRSPGRSGSRASRRGRGRGQSVAGVEGQIAVVPAVDRA